jgi:hypothetical protein
MSPAQEVELLFGKRENTLPRGQQCDAFRLLERPLEFVLIQSPGE